MNYKDTRDLTYILAISFFWIAFSFIPMFIPEFTSLTEKQGILIALALSSITLVVALIIYTINDDE